MRRFGIALVVAAVLAIGLGSTAQPQAQTSNAVAFCLLDTTMIGGPLIPTTTGWEWHLFCALNNSTGLRLTTNLVATTLSTDSLAQVGQKLANAVKADAATSNFNITLVLLPAMSSVLPTN